MSSPDQWVRRYVVRAGSMFGCAFRLNILQPSH